MSCGDFCREFFICLAIKKAQRTLPPSVRVLKIVFHFFCRSSLRARKSHVSRRLKEGEAGTLMENFFLPIFVATNIFQFAKEDLKACDGPIDGNLRHYLLNLVSGTSCATQNSVTLNNRWKLMTKFALWKNQENN